MATAVITVASGGLPVIDVTATTPKLGLPVSEAVRGIPVTKVLTNGLPVTFSTVPDYPPAGGGAFTPASLTGLVLWVDASVAASLTLSGSNVMNFADQSGAGNHLADLGSGVPCVYSATGFNTTYPTINFANSNSTGGLQKASGFTMGTGNTLTAFFVGSFVATGGTGSGRLFSYFAGAGGQHDYDNLASWNISQDASSTTVDYVRNSVVPVAATFGASGTPHRCIVTGDSSGNTKMYIDGVATSGSVSNAAFATGGQLRMGMPDQLTGSARWHGVVSEAGIATGFTNATDVAKLDTYLKNKWGL
jgi:hypothetical protein